MSEPVAVTRGLPSSIFEGGILGGKYRLEKEIGRGSMGTVWSAVHLTLGQRVAIKLIAAEHAQSAEARRRFSTEAKAAARLRSRYVVQVYDDGETSEGTPYIVLEYLDGETLEQRLERERDLPLNEAVRITRHVARALSRAHASGIVHRDLKPGNVFLARSDDDELGWLAKVLDFGIAKWDEHGGDSTTRTGTLLGTPLFMSPEQVRGANAVDRRSDLYSLGMVFYSTLTGGYAFNGESFADVLVAICTGPLPDLRAAAPWVPQSVAEWFQRACARDVQQRFQSADELIEGLDLALGVSTSAPARQSSPDVKLGTLHGFAPPVHHSLPRGSASNSDEGAQKVTQVLSTDRALLDPHPANRAHSLGLGDDELAFAPPSRRRWLVAGLLAALTLLTLLGGAGLLLRRAPGAPATSELAPPAPRQLVDTKGASPVPSVPEPAPPPVVALEASVPSAAPSAPSRPRSTTTKPAAAPSAPRNHSAAKGGAAPAVRARSTNTDIGF